MAPDILDPYSKLCEIQILDRTVKVPEGDLILRCFQYIFGDRISYGKFCWNNECANCEIRIIYPGQDTEKTVRACMVESRPGLRITQVPVEFRVFMKAEDEGRSTSDAGPTKGGGASVA